MTEFNKKENDFFEAILGAGSSITYREATGDKSVTLDKDEKKVLFRLYKPDSFTRAGGVAPDGKPESFPFYIFNIEDRTFKLASVVIKYPKSQGNELRLYFKKDVFYPSYDQSWFIFVRENESIPFIGACNAERLANLLSDNQENVTYEQDYGMDPEDMEYQAAIASPKARKDGAEYVVTSFRRDAGIAAKAIEESGFKCQINNEHETFISGSSGKPYVEVHHLIPMAFSNDFEYSLDNPVNLVVMCPNCHREIHYGTRESKKILIKRLYSERSLDLESAKIGISEDQLLKYYGCNV